MELTVNLVLIIVGLIICLGGIYFKKAVAGLVGMVSGMELGAILTLFLVFSADSDERGAIVIIFVCAAIVQYCVQHMTESVERSELFSIVH